MAQYPIGTATFTNGSRIVDVTNLESGRLGFFTRGTVVFVGADPTIKVVAATRAIDTLTFELDKQWDLPTGSYAFFGAMTSEAITDAVTDMRATTSLLQDTLDNFDTILTSTDPTVTVGDTTVVPFGYIIAQGQSDIDTFINNNQTEIDRLRVIEKIKRDAVFYADFTKDEAIVASDLSKTAQGVASAITYTAPDGQTGITADGRVATAGVNEPAIVYRDGKCQGLQVVPNSTNLFTHSSDYANADWNKVLSTIQSNVVENPNGDLTADKLVGDNGAIASYVNQILPSVTTGDVYAISVIAKAAENSLLRLRLQGTGFPNESRTADFDLSNGTIVLGGDSAKIEKLKNGWYLCSIWSIANSDASNVNADIVDQSDNFDGTSGIYLWESQLEKGYPTPIIPTTTTQLTRDNVFSTVTGMRDRINPNQFIAYVEVSENNITDLFAGILSCGTDGDNRTFDINSRGSDGFISIGIRVNGDYILINEVTGFSTGRFLVSVDDDIAECYANGQLIAQRSFTQDIVVGDDLGIGSRPWSTGVSNVKIPVAFVSNSSLTQSEKIALTTLE